MKTTIETTVKINIKNTELVLSITEARELVRTLQDALGLQRDETLQEMVKKLAPHKMEPSPFFPTSPNSHWYPGISPHKWPTIICSTHAPRISGLTGCLKESPTKS